MVMVHNWQLQTKQSNGKLSMPDSSILSWKRPTTHQRFRSSKCTTSMLDCRISSTSDYMQPPRHVKNMNTLKMSIEVRGRLLLRRVTGFESTKTTALCSPRHRT
jgi:ribosomal protein S18